MVVATELEWGFVCALRLEAATLVSSPPRQRCVAVGRSGRLVLCGMGAARARQAALLLADEGIRVLITWGVAGALDPALQPGQLLLPEKVIDAKGAEYPVDADLRALFLSTQTAVSCASTQPLFCAESAVLDRAGKKRLFERSGAGAVDLESAAVAAVAAQRGLPFVALRSVLDTAETTVPAFIPAAVDPFGQVRLLRFCAAMLRHPEACRALLLMARQSRLACDSLRSLARKLPALRAAHQENSRPSADAGQHDRVETVAADSR